MIFGIQKATKEGRTWGLWKNRKARKSTTTEDVNIVPATPVVDVDVNETPTAVASKVETDVNARPEYDIEIVIREARILAMSRTEIIQLRDDLQGIQDWAACLARLEDLNYHMLYRVLQAWLHVDEAEITAAFDRLPPINWPGGDATKVSEYEWVDGILKPTSTQREDIGGWNRMSKPRPTTPKRWEEPEWDGGINHRM